MTEVGSGRLVDELDEALVGMKAGDTTTITLSRSRRATTTDVELTLRDVKERVLPTLDDELARAASEFDTLDELRGDIEARFREQLDDEVEAAFREARRGRARRRDAVRRVADELVDRRAAELWSGLTRSLARRGIAPEVYLHDDRPVAGGRRHAPAGGGASGRSSASSSSKASPTKLGLEVTDEELDGFIREQAEQRAATTPRRRSQALVSTARTSRCAPTCGCGRRSTKSPPA